MNPHPEFSGVPPRHADASQPPLEPLSSAEFRLMRNREILRQHLVNTAKRPSGLDTASALNNLVAPVARQLVRQHPVATLSGAALFGAWMVHMKPWHLFGSSMMAGLLARQAISLSMTSGSGLFGKLVESVLRSASPSDTANPD